MCSSDLSVDDDAPDARGGGAAQHRARVRGEGRVLQVRMGVEELHNAGHSPAFGR